jgi:hypothetical protein
MKRNTGAVWLGRHSRRGLDKTARIANVVAEAGEITSINKEGARHNPRPFVTPPAYSPARLNAI